MKKSILILTMHLFAGILMAQLNYSSDLLAFDEPESGKDGSPVAITGAIRGKVIDASTGEGLIGAIVFLTGTTKGTITDFDGNFSMTDVYEQPFPVMDFNVSKQFRNGINLKFSAENLLNPYFEQTYSFASSTGCFRQYKLGRSFSIGLTYLLD
jgi:hypothetical protein